MSTIIGSSPPPTPSTELPKSRKQYRFVDSGLPCEWAEEYRPGGFHPVHIDDELKDGRYAIIRKLGSGSYSTVWLASDRLKTEYVAVKIVRAKDSGIHNDEIRMCQFLAEQAKNDALSKYTVRLLDTFELNGPNGIHKCLVFELMGPSAASLVDKLPSNQPRMLDRPSRYPKVMAKQILRQTIAALAFVHENGVTHGDVQPGNILFAATKLSAVEEKQLRQAESNISDPLSRLDGKPDLWAPKYLATSQSLHKYVDVDNVTVKLSDFGAAFFNDSPPQSTVTPVALRAPELIFHELFGSGIDVWAFGCLVYEFLTGTRLFAVDLIGNDSQESADDDHILELTDILGPLPERLMFKWPRKEKWIGPQGERLQPPEDEIEEEASDADDMSISDHGASGMDDNSNDCGAEKDGLDDSDGVSDHEMEFDNGNPEDEDLPEVPFINDSLETLFARNKPDDIDDEEAKSITSFMRLILQYEPSQRPTAAQLLQHEWFKT